MKPALFLLLASSLLAQHRGGIVGGPAPATYGSRSGFGNVVFPGTGHAPGQPVTTYRDLGFAYRLGATVGGYPAYTGGAGYRGNFVYVPYAYPAYGASYQQQPNVVVVYPQQPQQTSPPVIINQNFTPETAHPVVREYATSPSDGIRVYEVPRAAAEPPPPEEKRSYLIAFKDHTIYAAFTYWMEGDTFHYVTTHGTHNQVSLDRIDRDLTERLNRERNVDFRLPGK